MTCASCAARVERTLNDLDGVSASVNFATEKAAVEYDPACVTPEALVDAVGEAGYSARLPQVDTEVVEECGGGPAAAPRRGCRAVGARCADRDGPGAPVRPLSPTTSRRSRLRRPVT